MFDYVGILVFSGGQVNSPLEMVFHGMSEDDVLVQIREHNNSRRELGLRDLPYGIYKKV